MSTFTTCPDNLNWNRNAYNSVYRRSESSVTSVKRRELLRALLCEIRADENNARSLFQAFDIDEENDLGSENTPALEAPLHPVANALNTPIDTNTFRKSAASDSLSHPIHQENPFLSTPLRSKYFNKLSPSILRQLLRSPSPNAYTRDESFGMLRSTELTNTQEMPCENPQASQISLLTYPLTPPLTVRIPCTDSHEAPVRILHSTLELDTASTPGFHIKGVDFDPVPDIRACLSSMTPFTAIDSSQNKKQRLVFSATNSIVNSSVVHKTRSSLLSSDACDSHCEMPADGEIVVEERYFLESSARNPSRSEEASPLPAARTAALRSTPASPRTPKILRSGRVLRREFAELLEARAMEEEKQAQELDRMAKRLERLAAQRRRLLALMIKEKQH